MRKRHRRLFAKIEVLWWLTNPKRTRLSRQHSADYLHLVLQAVAHGSELVSTSTSLRRHFAREWGVRPHVVDRSLDVLSFGDDPLIKVLNEHQLVVCDYSRVVANPITGDSVVAPYQRDQDQDQEEDQEQNQDQKTETPVAPIRDQSNGGTDKATTTTTDSSKSGHVLKAKAALATLTAEWRGKAHSRPGVLSLLETRPKEVLAFAKAIQDNPEGLGNRWSVLWTRLTKGWDARPACVRWAEQKLRE
jgi:hypothetical protein